MKGNRNTRERKTTNKIIFKLFLVLVELQEERNLLLQIFYSNLLRMQLDCMVVMNSQQRVQVCFCLLCLFVYVHVCLLCLFVMFIWLFICQYYSSLLRMQLDCMVLMNSQQRVQVCYYVCWFYVHTCLFIFVHLFYLLLCCSYFIFLIRT